MRQYVVVYVMKRLKDKHVRVCLRDQVVFRRWQRYVNTSVWAVCVHTSGSHGGKGNVHGAAAVRTGLHLPAEEERGGGGAAASSRPPRQEPDSVGELGPLADLLHALGQRWRSFTGSYFACRLVAPFLIL